MVSIFPFCIEDLCHMWDNWEVHPDPVKQSALCMTCEVLRCPDRVLLPDQKRECENCLECTPLPCGDHGDCNETGLIVPNEGYCPSWNRDRYLIQGDDVESKF